VVVVAIGQGLVHLLGVRGDRVVAAVFSLAQVVRELTYKDFLVALVLPMGQHIPDREAVAVLVLWALQPLLVWRRLVVLVYLAQ
jgi:hypothetical protein